MAVPKSARITLVALVSVLLGVLFGPSLIPLDAGAHDAPAVSAHHGPPAP